MASPGNDKYISLEAFIKRCFYSILPADPFLNNWHISILAYILEMVYKTEIKRLVICMPPRYLKSICVSTAFPAWVLGKNPTSKIIVASYAMPLAEKLSVDTKNIILSPWYKEAFPDVELHHAVCSKRKFMTTVGGFRLASSIHGSLTGEGGDILIADDPQKPLDTMNKKYRDKTYNWILNTFFSRLNSKKNGTIIIVMQRLHVDDIVGRLVGGHLTGKMLEQINGWTVLNLAAVAIREEEFRNIGVALNEKTENVDTIKEIEKQIGRYFFNAQYQQNPETSKRGFLRKSQICFFAGDMDFFIQNGVFISIDSAFKNGANNDDTAITLWCCSESDLILFGVISAKMEFMEAIECVKSLVAKYHVLQILIEDKGSGTSLIQVLREKYRSKVIPVKVTQPKEVRFAGILSYFEMGRVLIADNVSQDVINQLISFPNGKHDDIVDSVSQFIAWYFMQRKNYTEPVIREL